MCSANVLLNLCVICIIHVYCADDYNVLNNDGSYDFGYDAPDSFHHSQANRNNVVRGQFGGRNPGTGGIDTISYTAGPRGFRPRGKNVVRKYDLNQNGPRAIGSRDDPYFDPNEDPSYNFAFRTRTYNRDENANRLGDVTGRYSYLDDVGERHNVEYIAGKNTGFHVKTPFPDSNPRAYGPLYFNGRGKPLPRGRTAIQRGLDGSYKFISAGPDQRRTETSDATGHVRGSYTYLDDKGVQHSVHYIAGPEIGYRVLKNVKGPHLPTIYPFREPEIVPPSFYDDLDKNDDVFHTAASGPIKPFDDAVGNKPFAEGADVSDDDLGTGSSGGNFPSTTKKPTFGAGGSGSSTTRRPFGGGRKPFGEAGGSRPFGGNKPSYDLGESDDDIDDLFGDGSPSSTTRRPGVGTTGTATTRRPAGGGSRRPGGGISRPGGGISRPDGGISRPGGGISRPGGGISRPGVAGGSYNEDNYDDGSYKPEDDGTYKPFSRPTARPKPTYDDDGSYVPSINDGAYRPPAGGSSRKPGGRPTSRPRPSKPSYDDEDSNDVQDDFGLFGKPTSNRPFIERPSVHIGISSAEEGSKSANSGGDDAGQYRHTIVTNVGDKLFSVPPGVSVRAHVQAIDLLPINSNVLSPSEQFKADTKPEDADNAETNNVISNSANVTTTTEPPTTIAATATTTTEI